MFTTFWKLRRLRAVSWYQCEFFVCVCLFVCLCLCACVCVCVCVCCVCILFYVNKLYLIFFWWLRRWKGKKIKMKRTWPANPANLVSPFYSSEFAQIGNKNPLITEKTISENTCKLRRICLLRKKLLMNTWSLK